MEGLCGCVEEHNSPFVGCESFEKGKMRYVQALPCGGKGEGRYEVSED